MIVKKYQGKTENDAVLKAKDELGLGAVVLSSKTIKQRGFMKLFKKDYVEITAALEEKEFVSSINEKKPTFQNKIDVYADEKIDTAPIPSTAIEAKLEQPPLKI